MESIETLPLVAYMVGGYLKLFGVSASNTGVQP